MHVKVEPVWLVFWFVRYLYYVRVRSTRASLLWKSSLEAFNLARDRHCPEQNILWTA